MLHISGWYDDVLVGTTENFANLSGNPNQFLMIGPWGHRINTSRKIGAIDFGRDALVDLDAIYLRWFDRWLKDMPNGVEHDPKVRAFRDGRQPLVHRKRVAAGTNAVHPLLPEQPRERELTLR